MFSLSVMQQGGGVMYVLLAASLLGVAYVLVCLYLLRRRVVLAPALVDLAENLSPDPGACAVGAETCRKEGGPFAEILLTVIETRTAGRAEAEALVESAGRRAAHVLGRGILVLEVVAAVSPLLGLLGTVIGMWETFSEISSVGVREIGQVSTGISKAMITTIYGLLVAIPAYVAHTYFTRRVDDLVLAMERHGVGLMARLRAE